MRDHAAEHKAAGQEEGILRELNLLRAKNVVNTNRLMAQVFGLSG